MESIAAETRASDTGGGISEKGVRLHVVMALAIVAIAAALRFLFIAGQEVWLDEAYAFAMARLPVGRMLIALALGNEPPLYSILLHGWIRIFGDGPCGLRSMSAVFSTATVAVIVFWDTPWLSRTARLLAGFILAITPLAIHYGQEARMYSPVVFFIVLSMVFLEKGLRVGGVRTWALFVVFSTLSFYTSYVAVYLVPAGYVAIASRGLLRREQALGRPLAALMASHAVVAVLFLPWLPTFMRQPTAKAIQWIRPLWQEASKASMPFQSVSGMTTGGAYYPSYLGTLCFSPERREIVRGAIDAGYEKRWPLRLVTKVRPSIALAASWALTLVLFVAALRSRGAPPYRTFLLIWLALSFGAPMLLSALRPIFVVGRYELPGLPAFALLSGIGLSRLRLPLRTAALALAAALFLYTWTYANTWPVGAGYREKGKALADAVEAGDVVLCEQFEYCLMYYHVGPERDAIMWRGFPSDVIYHSAWLDYDAWLVPPDWRTPRQALWDEAGSVLAEAISRVHPGGALVLVRPTDPPDWAYAMDMVLGETLGSFQATSQLVPDFGKSVPDLGIVLLRWPKPRDAVDSNSPGPLPE